MKNSILNFIWIILMIISIFLAIFFAYKIYIANKEYKEIDKVNEEIQQVYIENKIQDNISENNEIKLNTTQEEFSIKWNELIKKNNDVIGWIKLPNTNINYPIVQSKQNNEEYLRKNLYGKASSSGTIFIDYNLENPFECVNTVIYGHNINNGSMFSNLVKYKDKDFALKNNTILIYLPSGDIKEYNIFSFSEIDSNSSSIYSTDITNSSRYYNNIINFSKYNLLENKDRVDNLEFLTLSTCTNQNKEKRYVIHAYKTK